MRGFVLRPYDARRDLGHVLAAYADPYERAQFGAAAPTGDARAFDAWLAAQLRGAYCEFRVALDGESGGFVGFAYAYDLRPGDAHCKVCVYVAPAYQKAGVGGWLAASFMGGLFAAYPLRKVYALVYAYNRQSLESCRSAGFEEECRLREYRYFDGAYHDCVVLSLTRERHRERLAPLVDGGVCAAAGAGACEGAGAVGGGAVDVVLSVLERRCGRRPARGELLAGDLGFDSFDMLSAAVEIEDELCREVDAVLLADVRTVGDLCDAVCKAVG